jgi:TonB family protein
MSRHDRFWRNVTLIGIAHVAVITGLVRWNRENNSAKAQSIVWMSGGADDAAASATPTGPVSTPANVPMSTPEPKALQTDEADDDRPMPTAAKSEIQLPAPTPRPSSNSIPKSLPTPLAKVTPKPTSKPSPKPTPKPTTKPKPKPSPKKTILAKASPKPSPKVKPTPEESEETNDEETNDAQTKDVAKVPVPPTDSHPDDTTPTKPIGEQSGSGKGAAAGVGGHAGGAGSASQFGWYGSMLHDRFYSEWVQPASVTSARPKTSVLVKIRIEKDGRVSSFETIKPSGNNAIDESVAAISKRVTQVDPLPPGLGNGEHYDVKINFELNSEQ